VTYRVAARPTPHSTSLSARGAMAAVFAASVVGCLIASWARWDAFAGWVFFMVSGLVTYYVRSGTLLPVIVSPPAIFGAATVLAKVLTTPGLLTALSSAVVTLAGVAGWMFTGMVLTIAIGLGRGVTAEIRDLRQPS
jgi:hypothetical protein